MPSNFQEKNGFESRISDPSKLPVKCEGKLKTFSYEQGFKNI